MIGNFLKQKRLAMGLTQDFVAKQLNISRQAISNWENGSRDINIRDLIAYAKILEISFEDLEVHVNRIDGNSNQDTPKASRRRLPTHFNMEISKTNRIRPTKHIKIEGDKVVGVHILLTSLFFHGKQLTINNCPTALDFLNILYEFGNNEWVESTTNKDSIKLIPQKNPYDITTLNRISRASIGIISSLTYKFHQLLFTFPGGDNFCFRPIDLHLDILSIIANYQYDNIGKLFYSEKNDFLNKNVSFNCYANGSKSVGAFFNAISLAYVYPNEITINGISPDPTISYLVDLLKKSTNRKVKYLTPNKISISKVDTIEISSAELTLPPDMSMLVSYVLLFWDSLNDIIFDNVSINDIPESYLNLFYKLGLSVQENNNTIRFTKKSEIDYEYFEFLRLRGAPFITTDLGPIISEFLASYNVPSIIFDEVFINRFSHVSELKKLGINLKVLDNGALKTLPRTNLPLEKTNKFDLKDIRAGMAILMGINQTNISSATLYNFDQVLRGFGNINDVLKELGYEGVLHGKA